MLMESADTSYTDAPAAATLYDLARLIRRARYACRQEATQSQELAGLLFTNELLVRLHHTMRDALPKLADLARFDSGKRDFNDLYVPIMHQVDSLLGVADRKGGTDSLTLSKQLSPSSQQCVLELLRKVRSDDDWLLERLNMLSEHDLESLLPASTTSHGQSATLREFTTKEDSAQQLQRHNFLYLTLFGVYARTGEHRSEDLLCMQNSAKVLYSFSPDRKLSTNREKFCLAILDLWADVHGWGAHDAFESLLLEVLQTGTTLIDKAEVRTLHSTPSFRNYQFNHVKRDDAEDEFLTFATRRIFRLLDKDGSGGLPRGPLQLLQHVSKLATDTDQPRQRNGMLRDSYVSERQRQSILVPLQQKLISYCGTSANHPSFKRSSYDEDIENHIRSIFSKCRGICSEPLLTQLQANGHATPAARALNLPLIQGRPSFQLCATDLHTVFAGLCPLTIGPPAQSVSSGLDRHKSISSTGSGRPVFMACRNAKSSFNPSSLSLRGHEGDTSEIATEADEDHNLSENSGPEIKLSVLSNQDEDKFMSELRSAMRELVRRCNVDQANPAEDTWTHFVVKANEVCIDTIISKPSIVAAEPPDVVHRAVHTLIDSFDVRMLLMNRQQRSRANSLLRGTSLSTYIGTQKVPSQSAPFEHGIERDSIVLDSLAEAEEICLSRQNYNAAHIYHQAYTRLQGLRRSVQALNDYSAFIYGYCAEQERIIDASERVIDEQRERLDNAYDLNSRLLNSIDVQVHLLTKTRLKMWYVADIRKSKVWSQAWEVVRCIHRMGRTLQDAEGKVSDGAYISAYQQARPQPLTRSNSRDRRFSRYQRDVRQSNAVGGATSNLSLVDHATLEILSCPAERGGLRKLSSNEAHQTSNWLREQDIHNFCTNEERIHRLFFEIDDLSARLLKYNSSHIESMATSEVTASTIWQYDLFKYECQSLGISAHNESSVPESAFSGNIDESTYSGLLRRGSTSDLFSLGRPETARARGNSVGSLDRPRLRSRANSIHGFVATDAHGQVAYGATAQPLGRPPSQHLRRQASQLSSSAAQFYDVQDEKTIRDFLLQTQIGLISLLISDFVWPLFPNGSETDAWLNGDLAEAHGFDRVRHDDWDDESMKLTKNIALPMVFVSPLVPDAKALALQKKHARTKSTALAALFNGSAHYADNLKARPVPPSIDTRSPASSVDVTLERTSSTGSYFDLRSSADSTSTPTTPSRSISTYPIRHRSFPLQKVYAEIMHRLSVNTSPYEKLRALYEFELLVVSSLDDAGVGPSNEASKLAPSMPQSPMVQLSKSNGGASDLLRPHNERIELEDLARLRVEQLGIASAPQSPRPSSNASEVPKLAPGTDKIVEEMQRILRNPDIRPKTLFRDLQTIAAFIPVNILNMTDEGKVFWDVGLAALGVKKEILDRMVKNAQIRPQSSTAPPNAEAEQESATVFTIAAKERHVVAMRELAILQTKRPELVELVIPPFSNPDSIFSTKLNPAPSSAPRKVSPPSGVHHHLQPPAIPLERMRHLKSLAGRAWFELAAAEGDETAKSWLAAAAS